MDLNQLMIRISADIRDFQSGIRTVTSGLNGLSSEVSKVASNMSRGFKNVGSSISNMGNKLTSELTKPIAGLAQLGVEYNMTMESLQTSFKVMLGSEEKAIKMTQDLIKMGAATPFESTQLADYTKTLLSFGYTADKVLPIMGRIGDISLGNSAKMASMTRTMGQINALGKLQGGDLNQLIGQGWNPLNEIMKKTGETTEQIRKRMSAGKVTYKEVEQALISATSAGGQFYKGMEEGSKTFEGQISTLKDTWNMFVGDLTKPVFDMLKEQLPGIISKLGEMSSWFGNLSSGTKMAILAITGVAAAIGPLTIAGGVLVAALGSIIGAVGTVTAALGSFLIPIAAVGTGIAALSAGFVAFYATNAQFRDLINSIATGAMTLLGKAISSISYEFSRFSTYMQANVTPILMEFGNYVSSKIPAAKEALKAFANEAGKFLGMAWKDFNQYVVPKLMEFVETIKSEMPRAKKTWSDFVAGVKDLYAAMKPLIDWAWAEFKKYVQWVMQSDLPKKIQFISDAFRIFMVILENTARGFKKLSADVKRSMDEFQQFKKIVDDMINIGKQLIDGLIKGVMSKAGELQQKVASLANDVIGWFKSKTGFDINSPSRAMMEIGFSISEGLAKGMDDGLTLIERSAQSQMKSIQDEIDKINKLTESEDRDISEQKYQEQLAERYSNLEKIQDKEDYAREVKAINEMIADHERQQVKETRSIVIANYQEQIKELEKVSSKTKENLEKAVSVVKTNYDKMGEAIKTALKNQYESERDAIQARIDAVKDENKEKLRLYEEDYYNRLKSIEDGTKSEIDFFKNKIKQINSITERESSKALLDSRTKAMKELKAELDNIDLQLANPFLNKSGKAAENEYYENTGNKEKDYLNKIADAERAFQRKLKSKQAELSLYSPDVRWQGHDSDNEQREAIADINKEIEEMTREHNYDLEDMKIEYDREVEKMQREHNKNMADINASHQLETDKKVTELNKQRIDVLDRIKAAEEKIQQDSIGRQRATEIEAYNNRITAIETEGGKQKTMIQTQKLDELNILKKNNKDKLDETNIFNEAQKMLLTGNNNEIIKLLEQYNPNWYHAGETFGGNFLSGMKNSLKTTKSEITTMMNDIKSTMDSINSNIDAQNKKIIDAKRAWNVANMFGDKQGMLNAEAIANMARAAGGTIKATDRIPSFAKGVRNFMGGAAIVGEMGPELVTLPKGSNVTPNNKLGQNVTIHNSFSLSGVTIRSENDVKSLAYELHKLQESRNRGKGIILR